MTPKQQAFQDMKKAGLDTSVFNFEVILCGYKVDGRMTNGGKNRKNKSSKKRLVILKPKHNKKVKPFYLVECEGGFVVRID